MKRYIFSFALLVLTKSIFAQCNTDQYVVYTQNYSSYSCRPCPTGCKTCTYNQGTPKETDCNSCVDDLAIPTYEDERKLNQVCKRPPTKIRSVSVDLSKVFIFVFIGVGGFVVFVILICLIARCRRNNMMKLRQEMDTNTRTVKSGDF